MKLLILIAGMLVVIINMVWVVAGAIADSRKGDRWSTIERNLKASAINLAIATVFIVMTILQRLR